MKIIALITMVIDHLAASMAMAGWDNSLAYSFMRCIGRIAFPLYCFLIVNGLTKSSNRKSYLTRLMLFAIISQLPFTLVFSRSNYAGFSGFLPITLSLSANYAQIIALAIISVGTYFFVLSKRSADKGIIVVLLFMLLPMIKLYCSETLLLANSLSVFYTLACGLALIWLIDATLNKKISILKLILCAIVLALYMLLLQGYADYSYSGILLILGLYFARKKKLFQAIIICLWAIYEYSHGLNFNMQVLFCMISAILVLLYNNKLGKPLKLAFYAIYPVHLLLLGIFVVL